MSVNINQYPSGRKIEGWRLANWFSSIYQYLTFHPKDFCVTFVACGGSVQFFWSLISFFLNAPYCRHIHIIYMSPHGLMKMHLPPSLQWEQSDWIFFFTQRCGQYMANFFPHFVKNKLISWIFSSIFSVFV